MSSASQPCNGQFAGRRLEHRIVREDGQDLWAKVSNLTLRGCYLDCDLPDGEVISVELEGTALLIGEVLPAVGSGSMVQFFGATSH